MIANETYKPTPPAWKRRFFQAETFWFEHGDLEFSFEIDRLKEAHKVPRMIRYLWKTKDGFSGGSNDIPMTRDEDARTIFCEMLCKDYKPCQDIIAAYHKQTGGKFAGGGLQAVVGWDWHFRAPKLELLAHPKR